MNKSLYTKLVTIIIVLMLSLMTVVGAFLMRGVRNFYVSEFYAQMQEVFTSEELVSDLRAAIDEPDGEYRVAEILHANSGQLAINSNTRNYFVLAPETGALVTGSDDSVESIELTPNIMTAILGSEGYASDAGAEYMDIALPIYGESGKCIIYIIDNKETVTNLTGELFDIVAEALIIGLIISVILSMLLAKTMVTPLQSLTRAAEKVAAGDFSGKVKNSAQDEIGILTRTFNDMAIQLEDNIDSLKKSEKMRRDFVANVSHELRTPITSIKSYAETLQDAAGALDKDTEEHFLSVIVNESDRMSKIVQDLLILSKFDAGSISFDFQEFSFEKSVKDVYSAQRLNAQSRHHEFSLEFKTQIPAIIGDRARVEQVIINMVSNAIKYTPKGGIIRMTAGCEDGQVWCAVRDNGIGIPKEDVDHIFERFYRVDKARSRESGGTGLGLSIAYEIVERHGGSIAVKSTKGKGTTMTVMLPVEGPKNE